ncbi:hypothetical protein [Microbulbifer variabilis]|uniref:Uncharacterized protein n=1 Tax=Microbulbifer variabilis TaxID=266805 RepID=A0ABY4VB71_9GAMM|nr:hypothetical protein [Microbulbifer variabilis]USD19667.1 hypothetical protein MJO52_11285 [Microbulbifer variabilis]
MIHAKHRKSRALSLWAAPLLLSGTLLAAVFSSQVEAREHFGGRGAHFNVGGHFNAVRPGPGGGFHGEFARGDFERRFPNHPPFHPIRPGHHRHPPYPPPWRPRHWPYPGPRYWGVTAVGVGGWLYTLPPSCVSVTVGNVTYERCGSYWYQPHFVAGHIAYRHVGAPRRPRR